MSNTNALDEALAALANTTTAMLVLLKQLHIELNHPEYNCDYCKQYTDLSEANRQLFMRLKGIAK